MDPRFEHTAARVIAGRALLALKAGAVVALGAGLPRAVAVLAREQGLANRYLFRSIDELAVESRAAAGPGPVALVLLEMTRVDQSGSAELPRPGATASASSPFDAGDLLLLGAFMRQLPRLTLSAGALVIERDTQESRFVKVLARPGWRAHDAVERGRAVHYITERCVFRLTRSGLELIEIAPGVQLDRDVLQHMEFTPRISRCLALMDPRIFDAPPIASPGSRGSARPPS